MYMTDCSTTFDIRRTTEADRTCIARLNFLTDVFGDESKTPSEGFKKETKVYVDGWDPKDDGLVAWDDTIPAGGTWLIWGDVENHGVGFIDERTPEIAIAIEQPYRGKGLASQLLKEIVELARENGAPAVSLAVAPDNEHAEDGENNEYLTLIKKF